MFGKGITLFKLFGFSVCLDWNWLIIAALVTWSLGRGVFPAHYFRISSGVYLWMGAAGALGLFVSIILHEFGHSLAARQLGIPMRGITLFIFGGVAEMSGEPPNPKAEFLMAIAGPLVTVFLAIIFFGLASWSHAANWPLPVMGVLAYLTWINVVLLGFNLVTSLPFGRWAGFAFHSLGREKEPTMGHTHCVNHRNCFRIWPDGLGHPHIFLREFHRRYVVVSYRTFYSQRVPNVLSAGVVS